MNVETFKTLVTESEPPFVIRTTAGRSYIVADKESFWVPPPPRHTLVLSVPGKGVFHVNIESIESVQVI